VCPPFVGGTVLYHNQPNRLTARHVSVAQDDNKENQRDVVNAFISSVLLGEGKNKNTATGEGPRRENLYLGSNQSSVVVEWLDGSTTTAGDGPSSEERRNWIAMAVYPEVAIRKLHGVDVLLSSLMRRYALYYEHHCSKQIHDQPGQNARYRNIQLAVPPQDEFDSAFHSILRRFQDQLAAANASSNSISSLEKRPSGSVVKSNNKQQSQNATKKGKEKTVWHDGKQKITKAAFAELDMSKEKVDTLPGEQGTDGIREDARAIAEAKAAYMPTEGEKPAWEEEDEVLDDIDIHWNTDGQGAIGGEDDDSRSPSGIRGFFSKLLSPNSPLARSDLDSPLKQMQLLLTTKNVAPSTAQAICEVVEKQLLGKKVGTLIGVKRAVRHALEDAVERILSPELGGIGGRAGVAGGKSVDVLRGVVEKRERRKSGGGLLGGTLALFLSRRDAYVSHSDVLIPPPQLLLRCGQIHVPRQNCLLPQNQPMHTPTSCV